MDGSTFTQMAIYIAGAFSAIFILLITARIWYFLKNLDETILDGRALLSDLEKQIAKQIAGKAKGPQVIQSVINTASKFSMIKSEVDKLLELYKENTRLLRSDIISIILLVVTVIIIYVTETQYPYAFPYAFILMLLTISVMFNDLTSTWNFWKTYNSAKEKIVRR